MTEPEQKTQRYHGCPTQNEPIVGDRQVIRVEGIKCPHMVFTCCGMHGTEWVLDNTTLICLGCGLDCT